MTQLKIFDVPFIVYPIIPVIITCLFQILINNTHQRTISAVSATQVHKTSLSSRASPHLSMTTCLTCKDKRELLVNVTTEWFSFTHTSKLLTVFKENSMALQEDARCATHC